MTVSNSASKSGAENSRGLDEDAIGGPQPKIRAADVAEFAPETNPSRSDDMGVVPQCDELTFDDGFEAEGAGGEQVHVFLGAVKNTYFSPACGVWL